ncbi:hypothetical protein [Hydrogenimonas cancrithermarum]|uniref:Uncharacterized protein n=1 Tax=Hydrogenimonas cancrithermarum TaxID=2993563 RepID=A0ABM8FLY1_9BACT|nr:hypothetical protein [Hydrogenimonas cancrithermarum]BDY12714.1 hypothetical protein HCR_10260 [Hydrogenimonas cancrithermarum]
MKFAKLSLAAIMAMGISAFADVKVSGDVKVYYGTNDADKWDGVLGNAQTTPPSTHTPSDASLFGQDNSYANAAVSIDAETELADSIKAKVGFTMLETMGLESSIVSDVWAGSKVGSQMWFDEANLQGTVFDKTAVIFGRQYLDTPMVFSERWNIAANSYDAAVVADSHLEKTTLVAAWVMRSNVNGGATVATDDRFGGQPFTTFGDNGAYAFGAVTTAIPMTTAQAWYYAVDSVATAYWLQADVTPDIDSDMKLEIGVQFAGTALSHKINDDATVWAAKVGVNVAGFDISGAYSSADKGDLGFTNVGGAQSKLYTEAWWNYGYVSAPDTDAYNVSISYMAEGIAKLGAYYTATDSNDRGEDLTEFTLTADKSFGAFDAALAYIYTDAENQNNDDAFNTVQVYLTYNF